MLHKGIFLVSQTIIGYNKQSTKSLRIFFAFLSFCLLIGCSFKTAAIQYNHPANQYFNSIEYPRIGMNQISTRKLRNNPDAIRQVAKLDMIIINKSNDLFIDKDTTSEYARKIKALNPKIKVLQYLSISDIWNYQQTFKEWCKQHPEALLRTAKGEYIHPYEKQYGKKRYMFDSTQPVWQDYFAARMKKITDQGMDGIFVDNLWRSNWQNLNISPEKFKQIQKGWETALQKGRILIGPNKIIIGNSPPYELYQTRDLSMLEGKLGPTKESFQEYLDFSRQAKSYNQLIFDTVKYDTYLGDRFVYVPSFFLPVVLLTDNVWGFSYESSQWFDLVENVGKIGYPISSAKKQSNGIWIRDFTRGRVLFNESNTSQKVSLPENTYVNINKVSVNEITLSTMRGIVLKKK